jgi:hypothetical protein
VKSAPIQIRNLILRKPGQTIKIKTKDMQIAGN